MDIEDMEDAGNLSQAKKDWERLLENPAWVQLVRAIQAQVDTLQNEILFGSLQVENYALVTERKKGQFEGRLSLIATAEAMAESVSFDLQAALEKKEENEE